MSDLTTRERMLFEVLLKLTHSAAAHFFGGSMERSLTIEKLAHELLTQLHAVNEGGLTIERIDDGDDWTTDRIYRLPTGFEIAVFMDCGSWDYVDRFRYNEGPWVDVHSKHHSGVEDGEVVNEGIFNWMLRE